MQIIKTETLCLTEEEMQILNKARHLLEEIYAFAEADGEMMNASYLAMENICELLKENCEVIEG